MTNVDLIVFKSPEISFISTNFKEASLLLVLSFHFLSPFGHIPLTTYTEIMPLINKRVAYGVQISGLRYESPGSQVIPDSEEERQRCISASVCE